MSTRAIPMWGGAPLLLFALACSSEPPGARGGVEGDGGGDEDGPDDTAPPVDSGDSEDDTGETAPPTPVGTYADEPNDTRDMATALPYGGGGRTTVGGDDAADWFVVEAGHEGELRAWVLDGDVTLDTERVGDRHYVSVTADTLVEYALVVDFRPDEPSLDAPGTVSVGRTATVTGSGLGTRTDRVTAWIGGARAPVVAAHGDSLDVEVPYGASSGELVVVTGGRRVAVEVAVDAPGYPDVGYDEVGTMIEDDDGHWLSGAISVRAEPTVTAEELLAAVSAHGLTSAGWGPARNRHRLAGAPEDLDDIVALAAELEALDEVAEAAPIGVGEEAGLWATAPLYADDEARYDAVLSTGLPAAWRWFEAAAGDPLGRVKVALVDTGIWSAQTNPCAPSTAPYPAEDGEGGFALGLFDGSSWQWPTPDAWVDRGDITPGACDDKGGHGSACVGIFGGVGPARTTGSEATGALAGFARAGVDVGLPFEADVWSTRKPGLGSLLTDQMADAIAEIEADGYAVASLNWGWLDADGNLDEDPFGGTDTLWVVAAHNDNQDPSVRWPQRFAVDDAHLMVGATSAPSEARATGADWGSNYGPDLDVAAPTYIHTYVAEARGPYADVSGTSASTPFVAAAAAFVRWVRPDLRAASAAALVRETGFDIRPYGDWSRTDPLPRLDWMKLLLSDPIQEVLAPTFEPMLLVADRDDSGDSVSLFLIDPETGLPSGAATRVPLPTWGEPNECVGPVDIQVTPDGSRAAISCNDSDSIAVMSLHSLEFLGSVALDTDIGLHSRAWMDPAGVLHMPVGIGGGAGVALVDVYGPEVVTESALNSDTVPWTVAPLDHGSWMGVMVSSTGDAGQLTTYTPDTRNKTMGAPIVPGDLRAHYSGTYPSGLALSPDGDRLVVSYGGRDGDTELVDVSASGGFASPVAGQGWFMRGSVLERPYDVAWMPDTGLDRDLVLVASWENDQLVAMRDSGGGYPDRWAVEATWATSANPERVHVLQSGRAVYTTGWNGNLGIATLPHTTSDLEMPLDDQIGGFERPVAPMTTPLVSIVHPRDRIKGGRFVRPTVLLRDRTAVTLSCTLEDLGGGIVDTQVVTLPSDPDDVPGLYMCGPFDLQNQGPLVLVTEVESVLSDGTAPVYSARVRVEALP